jgi:acyl transferase domain-containing protein
MASLIKMALALREGTFPPQHAFASAAPEMELQAGALRVQTAAAPWAPRACGEVRRALVNSIGFGGVNYALCLESAEPAGAPAVHTPPRGRPAREPVAVIGMGGVFPGAADVPSFWRNNVEGADAVREVPAARFDIGRYLDPDRNDRARSYTRLCTVVDDVTAPLGLLQVPPRSAEQIDPTQVLALRAVAEALADSGVMERGLDRDHTAVIMADMPQRKREMEAVLRLGAVEYRAALEEAGAGVPAAALDEAEARFKAGFLPVTEDTLVGYLGGIISGRVARRFGLRGPNLGVESACASSLHALSLACQGLQQGRFSVAIAGGVCCNTSPEVFSIACSFNGLSARGISPFDAGADGFIGGEGAGAVVLKRLRDARADGDRVLGIVRGIGASSDGASRSVFAPDAAGQALAVRRALEDARLAPRDVDWVECHGTGTYTGDASEVTAYAQSYGGHGRPSPMLLSSVKSMIGHLNAAAGMAALVRVLCALQDRRIPPTLHFGSPNPDAPFAAGPFEVATRTLPWPAEPGRPRRAGISSFGLGGSNVHVILEESPS